MIKPQLPSHVLSFLKMTCVHREAAVFRTVHFQAVTLRSAGVIVPVAFQLALKFELVIASLLDYNLQWEVEVFQRTELWRNDLSLTRSLKSEVLDQKKRKTSSGVQMTDMVRD